MRNELELMELADRYLRGEMSTTDHAAFEDRIHNDAALRELVSDQRALLGGMDRLSLRTEVNKAHRSYKLGKWLPGIGGAVVIAVLAAGLWSSASIKHSTDDVTDVPKGPKTTIERIASEIARTMSAPDAPLGSFASKNSRLLKRDTSPEGISQAEVPATLVSLPDTQGIGLSSLVFSIDPTSDTTLITPNGLVLDIPKGAFIDADGRAITTPVRVTLLEAIDGLDIMKAGLSTMSGDTLLETGGMFYIDAQVDGKRVDIEPKKPLTVMVPITGTEASTTPRKIQEARVRHILLSTREDESDVDQMLLADSLLAVLKHDRGKFQELASRFSDDLGSAKNGGAIEWFDRSRMVPEFNNASFDHKQGSMNITKTEYGYHIVEVLGHRIREVNVANDQEMQLYEGVMGANGIVDWRNPKPLVRSLIPVDINTLDFYPPGYLAKLAEFGRDASDRSYTDSMYWSMDCSEAEAILSESNPADGWLMVRSRRVRFSGGLSSLKKLGRAKNKSAEMEMPLENPCGISPTRVKALWDSTFNNTNLATREFEERMRAIHFNCDDRVLDLYANNLDRNLSYVDSMAVRMGHGAFAAFALRNDGRVALPEHAAERLKEFYTTRSRVEAEAIRKVTEQYQREQREQDIQAARKRDEHTLAERIREGQLFQREFEANLDTVYKQLGYPRARSTRSAWVVPVRNSGWRNVDKAVMDATTARTSMSYTDDKTGKTATLTYTPITIEVEAKASYSELRVYLIPKALNSYQRVPESNGAFTERLNANFQYDLVCMGRRDGQLYAATRQDISASTTIRLQATTEEELRHMVRTPQVNAALVEDLVQQSEHLKWLELEALRQQAKRKREELRQALLPVVFPCAGRMASSASSQ